MVLTGSAPADARSACGRRFLELCTWAATTSLDAVPAQVRRRASLILADDIAAIVAAATEPEVVAIQARARPEQPAVRPLPRYWAAPPCASIATPPRPRNGLAICWTELDEGYRLVACHAGAYIIPALIAEAEATGAPTADVIASLAVAYEVTGAHRARLPRPAVAGASARCLRSARRRGRAGAAQGLRPQDLRSGAVLGHEHEPRRAL